ncbi:hypothetical protein jhhlp_005568 [Lomentospora prolificans]|uniref:Methyltransferase type 11 domain-containing protein n=1 Tax=Lomentospora prolificans TaxID=41688 RepID=A0A2N3N3I9_9PEZI|nr:hypothetical protein jhhlp_005568 [Lomentospora prolificans]
MGTSSPLPPPQTSLRPEPGPDPEPAMAVPELIQPPVPDNPATTATTKPQSSNQPPAGDPDHYEQTHVHSVYESIASHFSQTRHKPWPFVSSFLHSLPPGSLGLDVGCGNGKYIAVNPNLTILASDRSASLCRLARENTNADPATRPNAGADVCVADSLALPFRPGCADFVICIAVVHHFSTPERRREAIAKLLECVRPGGKVLVYVWALEQRASRRGWDEGGEQDLLVPWVMRSKKGSSDTDETYQRYYHLYRKGELEEDVAAAGGQVLDTGYEKDNWWVVCTR